MQQRWQNSIADQAFGNAVGKAGPKPFSISSCILGIVAESGGLLNSRPRSCAGEEDWMGEIFVS